MTNVPQYASIFGQNDELMYYNVVIVFINTYLSNYFIFVNINLCDFNYILDYKFGLVSLDNQMVK